MLLTIKISAALAKRSLVNVVRRPQLLAPVYLFPTLLLAINVGGFGRTKSLPGFPVVDSFLDFQLAGAMTQSLLLGAVSTGVAMALDIEGGFFDRLVAAPIPRISIVFGRLAATAVISLLTAVYFLAIGFIFGDGVHSGIVGVLVILSIALIAGTGLGGFGTVIALRTRSTATVQGIFPLLLVVLFLSSAFFPRDLLRAPASWVASYNPLSYIAGAIRNPIIEDLSVPTVLEGLACSIGVLAFTVTLSVLAFNRKIKT